MKSKKIIIYLVCLIVITATCGCVSDPGAKNTERKSSYDPYNKSVETGHTTEYKSSERDDFVGQWVRVDEETITMNINSDGSFEGFEEGHSEGGGTWEFDDDHIVLLFGDNSGTIIAELEDGILTISSEEYGISLAYKKRF